MSARFPLAAALLLGVLAVVPAHAQGPAETGTGGGPGSTITAPNTTSVGQTKPPGGAGGGVEPSGRMTERTAEEKKNDKILKGICIGCSAQ